MKYMSIDKMGLLLWRASKANVIVSLTDCFTRYLIIMTVQDHLAKQQALKASDRSDEVCVKSRENQKNYKNNEVIMITSVCVFVGVESCDETCTHTRTHNGNTHTHTPTLSLTIPSLCLFFRSVNHCIPPVTPSSCFIYSFIYSLLL